MKHVIALALILAPLPALADPLKTLEPLIKVFGAEHDTPGWDVAGIRCAGFFYAQDVWRDAHGGNGPTRRQLEKVPLALDQAVYHRVGLGQDLTTATISVEADLQRVVGLYAERFAANAKTGHPWNDDPDLQGDRNYCKAALS
ncbi:MAG: hypothetical protein JNN02_02265 [Tabrizicola sp.]|nr:hypothetical protein [Tabrizicola sp.]